MRDPYSRLAFKYAPKKFDELILNPKIKNGLKKALVEMPTMFLVGPRGIGKGSFTNVFLNETKCPYLWVNGSDDNGVDVVRTKIWNFAITISETLKIVVINEIDRFTPDAQRALLEKIEKVEEITRFILIGNHNVLIPELQSRCQIFEFFEPPANEIFERCKKILNAEGITYNKKAILTIIKKKYPDIRQILHTIDQNIIDKKLSDDLLIYDQNIIYEEIVKLLLKTDDDAIDEIRKILRSKSIDYNELYDYIYNEIDRFDNPAKILLKLGEAIRFNNLVALKEINFMTFVIESIL